MKPFAETSFLCSLYRSDVFSPEADAWTAEWGRALPLSTLVLFEFRQFIRLQTRLFGNQPKLGLSPDMARQLLRQHQQDVQQGVLEVLAVDWPSVHRLAEELSERHTWTTGIRFADILHVATALHLDCRVFLTFDTLQTAIARKEGLDVPGADGDNCELV